MTTGVTWNLFCKSCKKAWVEKIFGPEVSCPDCGSTFTVGFRPTMGQVMRTMRGKLAAENARRAEAEARREEKRRNRPSVVPE